MFDSRDPVTLQIGVSLTQLGMIDEFQIKERLQTRGEALSLLMDIALDSVNASGRRFWDKAVSKAEE